VRTTSAAYPWPEREKRGEVVRAVSGEAKSENKQHRGAQWGSMGLKTETGLNADFSVRSSLQPHSAPEHRYIDESPLFFQQRSEDPSLKKMKQPRKIPTN